MGASGRRRRSLPTTASLRGPSIRTGFPTTVATARAVAELNGIPGYAFVVAPHPFGSLDEATVRKHADEALSRIERLLLGEPP